MSSNQPPFQAENSLFLEATQVNRLGDKRLHKTSRKDSKRFCLFYLRILAKPHTFFVDYEKFTRIANN